MPEPCRTESTLTCWPIGGQLDPMCCNDAGEWPDIRVTAELVGASQVCDPSNDSFLVLERKVTYIGGSDLDGDGEDDPDGPVDGDPDTVGNPVSDGCWCSCDLKANIAADPNDALQPSGTRWRITVAARNASGAYTNVISQTEIQIDADADYEGDGQTIDTPCGPAINIKYLLEPIATVPPLATFCSAVYACLGPLDAPDLGTFTGDYENGWSYTLTCADVVSCLPAPTSPNGSIDIGGDFENGLTFDVEPAVVTTDGDATGVNQSGPYDNVIDLTVTSQDGTNIATIGSDGGTLVTCAAVIGCLGDIDSADGSIVVTGDYASGWDLSAVQTTIVVTTDGSATGVTQSGPNGEVIDLVLTSTDAGQIGSIGSDGGFLVTCADVVACETLTSIAFDGVNQITYIDENGDPTVLNLSVLGIDISLDGLSLDPGTLDLTVTDDGGDSFTVSLASLRSMITQDLAAGTWLHDDGNGTTRTISSTSADPSNIATVDPANGGTLITCANVIGCLGSLSSPDGSVTVGGDYASGWTFTVPPAPGETTLVVTTDGDATGVNQSGTADHTVDIVVRSTDADQIATTGTDGGLLVTCANVIGCLGDLDSADGSVGVTGDHASGWDLSVDVCALIQALPQTGTVPGAGVEVLGSDCQFHTLPAGGGGSFNSVDADGTTAVFDTVNDCVPLGAFQRVSDHEGTDLDAAGCVGNPLTLHRSMVIGAGHVGGTEIGVSNVDSDDAAIVGVTTHHINGVIASTGGSVGAANDVVIASLNASATGGQSLATGEGTSATGPNSIAAGFGTVVSGAQSFGTGTNGVNDGDNSSIYGNAAQNFGDNSQVGGDTNTNRGINNLLLGFNNYASDEASNSLIFGSNNILGTDGNGHSMGNWIVGGANNNVQGNPGAGSTSHGAVFGNGNSLVGSDRLVVAGVGNSLDNSDANMFVGNNNTAVNGTQRGFFGGNQSSFDGVSVGVAVGDNLDLVNVQRSIVGGQRVTANAANAKDMVLGVGVDVDIQARFRYSGFVGRNHTMSANVDDSFISGNGHDVSHDGVGVFGNTPITTTQDDTLYANQLILLNLPVAFPGGTGIVWNNGGVLNIT